MIYKYRSESGYSERNPIRVMTFECHELGNIDILKYLREHYLYGDLKRLVSRIISQSENPTEIITEESFTTVFELALDQIKGRTGKDIKYCVWLADRDIVENYYCSDLIEYIIYGYDIEGSVILSDLGIEGKLYGFEELPDPVEELIIKEVEG